MSRKGGGERGEKREGNGNQREEDERNRNGERMKEGSISSITIHQIFPLCV